MQVPVSEERARVNLRSWLLPPSTGQSPSRSLRPPPRLAAMSPPTRSQDTLCEPREADGHRKMWKSQGSLCSLLS